MGAKEKEGGEARLSVFHGARSEATVTNTVTNRVETENGTGVFLTPPGTGAIPEP